MGGDNWAKEDIDTLSDAFTTLAKATVVRQLLVPAECAHVSDLGIKHEIVVGEGRT